MPVVTEETVEARAFRLEYFGGRRRERAVAQLPIHDNINGKPMS